MHHNLALQKQGRCFCLTCTTIFYCRSRSWYFCLLAPQFCTTEAGHGTFASLVPQSSTAEAGHGTFPIYLHHNLALQKQDVVLLPTAPQSSTAEAGHGTFPACLFQHLCFISDINSSDLVLEKLSKVFHCMFYFLNFRATSGPTNFVFGQNLHERVVTYEDSKSDSSSSISNQLNFQAFQKSSSEDERQECTGKPVKSLTQSAEEYQARQAKRKYDEVTVVTGEEGESNVLQINCKLFAFEKNSSWVERGRGMLRLNDREVDGTLQSRLVMRTQGSHV
ncbi:uncharacterized protein LOC143233645 [Tachypleus tridentatus]|uniref:uncharacterized protein LOC143233645 n=1 Tax=Tachypleus tridentatus TaxID=6853 RepID=UPI003FD022CA